MLNRVSRWVHLRKMLPCRDAVVPRRNRLKLRAQLVTNRLKGKTLVILHNQRGIKTLRKTGTTWISLMTTPCQCLSKTYRHLKCKSPKRSKRLSLQRPLSLSMLKLQRLYLDRLRLTANRRHYRRFRRMTRQCSGRPVSHFHQRRCQTRT